MVDIRVTSLTSSLKTLVQLQHRSHASLEKDLGWKAGTISRLFSGHTKMTLRHVVLLLRALRIRPEEFSAMTFRTASRHGRRPKPRSLLRGSGWDDLLDF